MAKVNKNRQDTALKSGFVLLHDEYKLQAMRVGKAKDEKIDNNGVKIETDSSNDSYAVVDFAHSIPKGYTTTRVHVNKVILNNAVPKHWKFKFDAKSLEIDSVVHLLSDTQILTSVIKALENRDFVSQFFEDATNARSGVFYTNTALLTYDLIVQKVGDVAGKLGISIDPNAVLVITALLVDTLNELGIVAYSGGSYAIVTKARLFANYDDLVTELRKVRISNVIAKIDKTKIKTTSKMGVGVLAQLVSSTFAEVAIALSRLQVVEQDLDSVFALVRAFTTKTFTSYTQDELVIFEDPQFLEFATNLTFVIAALNSGVSTRPSAGSFYWGQILARVNLGLRSSTAVTVTELAAVKEFFRFSIINDEHGMKKGIILTKNYKDETPFEPYFVTKSGIGYNRIMKDSAAEMSMTNLVGQLKKVESATLHDYFVKMFSLITTSKVNNFGYTAFVGDIDVVHLAAAFCGQLELASQEIAPEVFHRTFVYEVSTRDSRVAEQVSGFGVAKFLSPLAVLFFGPDEFVGKKILSYNEPVISETDRISYAGLDAISTDKIGRDVVMDIPLAGTKVRTTWRLDKLLSMPSLAYTRIIVPVIGREIISKLVASYREINDVAQSDFGMQKDFQLTMALQFAKIIEPMFLSQDIEQITTSAISDMWDQHTSMVGTSAPSLAYIRSSFYDHKYKTEMKFRAAFFVAYANGFIDQGSIIKELADIMDKGGVFNHI